MQRRRVNCKQTKKETITRETGTRRKTCASKDVGQTWHGSFSYNNHVTEKFFQSYTESRFFKGIR